MSTHKSFPKPGGAVKRSTKGTVVKAPKKAKPTVAAFDKKVLAREAKKGATPKAAKAKPAGPTVLRKPKPVDEGNGTSFVPLTEAEIAAMGMKLARKLHDRESELRDQADTKKGMADRLSEIDTGIYRMQTAMREKREERPSPGLFDKLDKHKEKPLAKDTMKKAEPAKDDPEQGFPKCVRPKCGHRYTEHEKVTVAGATPGQTICKRNGTPLACACAAYSVTAEPTMAATLDKADAGATPGAPFDVRLSGVQP
jgi:hypothetical protein